MNVDRGIRDFIQKNIEISPENLPVEKKLPEVKKELKKGYKSILREDKK